MGTAIIVVAVAAAIGVGLVVYGTLRAQRPAGPEEQVRVSYRTLADVREQLRRRFESTGTPNWIAAEQQTSKLQRDLVRADQVALELAGLLLGGDPVGCAGRLKPAPQLLPDVSESSIRDADLLFGARRPLRAQGPVDHESNPDGGR